VGPRWPDENPVFPYVCDRADPICLTRAPSSARELTPSTGSLSLPRAGRPTEKSVAVRCCEVRRRPLPMPRCDEGLRQDSVEAPCWRVWRQ